MVTAYGIMQALFMRERTGEGQMVDSAMYDNMLSLNESMLALFSVAGQSPHRGRPRNAYPRGAYRTKDGYIALNVPDERIWGRLAEVMGHPELASDERTSSGPARAANREFLDPIINAWMENLTRAEVVDKLNDIGDAHRARAHRRGCVRLPAGGSPRHAHGCGRSGGRRVPIRAYTAAFVASDRTTSQAGAALASTRGRCWKACWVTRLQRVDGLAAEGVVQIAD